MDRIRLGIIGPGRIVQRVMTDIPNCEYIELTAIASRELRKAEAAAKEYGAKFAYGDYESMARSSEVDLVYIATPNNVHAQQACLMMNNGKHVICEKPLCMNGEEARKIFSCAKKNKVFFMEAMWTRFMPAIIEMRKIVANGEIGALNHIFADFSYASSYDPNSRLYRKDLGGGSLLDVGVYAIMAVTMFMGWKPTKVLSSCVLAPSGVDRRCSATLVYENGSTGQIFSGVDTMSKSDLILFGEKGTIHCYDFWHCERFTVEKAGAEAKEYDFPHETEGHRHEFDHAAKCIMSGITESPLMTYEESIAVTDIMTAIRKENGIFFAGE